MNGGRSRFATRVVAERLVQVVDPDYVLFAVTNVRIDDAEAAQEDNVAL
jgi:hypothetical protein